MATFGIEGIRYFSSFRRNNESQPGDLTYVFNICNGLSRKLRGAGHSKKFYLANQDCGEQDLSEPAGASPSDRDVFADSVDLYWIYTHGTNARGYPALFFNSTRNDWSTTGDFWSLGNQRLCWLFIYGCQTVDRSSTSSLVSVFQGLHALCGAWGNMYDGWTVDDVGDDVGDHLIQGHTIREAWLDGVSDWWVDNHPIIVCAETSATQSGGVIDWSATTMFNERLPAPQTGSGPIGATWLSVWWAEG